MFSIFKRDPRKKLNQALLHKLKLAMEAQRNGDIRLYSELSTEAEQIEKQLVVLEVQAQEKAAAANK